MQKNIDDVDGTLNENKPFLADDRWIRSQKNTFTRWVNFQLKPSGLSIEDLQTDFSDGLKLIKLIEVLSGQKFAHINKDPKIRPQKLENVTMVLQFLMEKEQIKLVNIDSTHIVDGNLKLILGLVWTLISHYTISIHGWGGEDGDKESSQTLKQRLLAWLNTQMVDRPVKNLTTDWNDGKAIGALVDSCAPGLCPDWNQWKRDNNFENTTDAMETAERWLNVPKLIKAEEMIDPDVDEKAMITYLSQFPNAKLNNGAPIKDGKSTRNGRDHELYIEGSRERLLENQANNGDGVDSVVDLDDVIIIKNDIQDKSVSNGIIMQTKRLRKKYPNNMESSEELRTWLNTTFDKSWAVFVVRGQFWTRYSYFPDNNIIFKIKNEIYIIFKTSSD